MGRPRKNNISDTMEQQIEKAQAKVIKTKAAYLGVKFVEFKNIIY